MNWNKAKCFHPPIATIILVGTCMLASSWPAAGGAARAAPLSPGTIVVGLGNIPQIVPSLDTRLIAVDPNTGATSIVSDNAVGTGPSLAYGTDGSYISYLSQQSDGSLLAVDDAFSNVFGQPGRSLESRLYRVDPSTGDRSLILDVTGTTPDKLINAARQIGSTIYATTNAGLETVDPTTGVVTPITTTGTTINQPLYGFANIGNQIYAAGSTDIYKIDTTTGAASVVAGPSIGGPAIDPVDLTFDALGHLYAAGTTGTVNGLYSVDPTTGNTTPVSTSTSSGGTLVGSGPAFQALTIGTAASTACLRHQHRWRALIDRPSDW